MSRRGFTSRWDLLLPAVLAPAAEVALVSSVGPRSALALAPQITAPPPFDLFHDLRWVSVYHNSWWMLALQLVAVLVLRSLWVAWVVQRSWPGDDPPSMWSAVRRVAAYQVVAAILLTPWVVLLFGLALTHLSFLFFAALPPALLIAVAIHGGAASRAGGSRYWGPTGAGLLWILGAFLWLTVAGALIDVNNAPTAVLIASGAGVLNARGWYGIVQSMARPERLRVRVPALSAALVGFTLIVSVGGPALGFSLVAGRQDRRAEEPTPPTAGDRPVLVAPGLYSRFDTGPLVRLPEGYALWRFSYRGIDREGRPLPYEPRDTLQPVLTSARRMADQVEVLAQAYGRPVTIVAESAGALVARTYLVELYDPDSGHVNRLITLNMPSGASSVYFPRIGDQGWGVGTGWALRGLGLVIDRFADFDVSADSPFVREAADCRDLFHRVLSEPLPPDIHEVSIEALADWVDRPDRSLAATSVLVVNAPHGGLIHRAPVQDLIGAILEERERSEARNRAGPLIAAVARPWLLPALNFELAPAARCDGPI